MPKHIPAIGSRAEVWHNNAKHTRGGLTKKHLMKNKHGRIVSRRKHNMGKKSIKHLRHMGFIAHRGEFKLFRKDAASRRRKRGGSPYGGPLSPHAFDSS